jgi:hypothetical protein
MLDAPSRRLAVLRRAERFDPYQTRPFRHHATAGIRRLPPAIGEM